MLATNSRGYGFRSAVCGEAAHAMGGGDGGGGGGRRLYYAEFAVVEKMVAIFVGVVPADAAGWRRGRWTRAGHPAAHMSRLPVQKGHKSHNSQI
jgi:hypothetical protein